MRARKFFVLVASLALIASPLNTASAATSQSAIVTPPALSIKNPITFATLLQRINDIPTYAYTNAQVTVKNNANLQSTTHRIFEVKGTHLATNLYQGSVSWIKKNMAMYGHFVLPSKVYLFEYPEQDIKEIQGQATKLITDGEDVAGRAAAIYGTGSFGAGTNCQKTTPMRANTTETMGISNIFGGTCEGSDPLDARTGVAHEFAHGIQVMQFHNKGKASKWHRADRYMYYTLPCWPVEGQAAFTGFANLDNLAAYKSIRQSGRVHPYLLPGAGGTASVPDPHWTSKDVLSYYKKTSVPGTCETDPSFALGYSLGFLTIEALTAIAGPESHMAVVQRIAEGESLDQAFKEIYGLAWTAAAPLLAQVVAVEIMAILDPPSSIRYVAKSTTNVKTFIGHDGCGQYSSATPYAVRARLQALVNGRWEDVTAVASGWTKSSECAFLPNGGSLAYVKAAIDPGTSYRWIYLGPVNIAQRDEFGRGISSVYIS